ncbi:hypothetical protein RRG08_034176 [Elysia crispata]|uniref:Uncharacterized protein n=1 Tax=Elysia crispata TaxID=231223 RepID=A0AAE1AAL1_9GAST|nr:hypothetical protein RRG08_034176 [Elysia crispata]
MPLPQNSVFDGIGFGRAVGHLVPGSQCQKRKLIFDMADVDHDMTGDFQHQQWLEASSNPKRQCLWESKESFHLGTVQQPQQQPNQEMESLPGCLKNSSPTLNFCSSSIDGGMQATQDIAAAVSFSSAALTSSSPQFSEHQASPSLADLFKSRLRQRQQEVGQPTPLETNCSVNNNDSNYPSQNFYNMTGLVVGNSGVKETNNNSHNNNNNNNSNSISKDSGCSQPPACSDEEVMEAQTAMDSDFVPDVSQYAPPAVSSPSPSPSLAQPVSSPQNIYRPDERRCGYFTCSGRKPSPVTGRLHCLCSASWRGMYGMEAAYMTDYY